MADKSLRHIESFLDKIVKSTEFRDVLRHGLEAVLAAMMETEVQQVTGAGHGEHSDERMTHRNGYRDRSFNSALGTSILRIPKIRQGSYYPSFLKSRQRSDDALVLAIAECYQQGVSTRKMESIGRALGVESLSKSTVSRILKMLDPQVEAFRQRVLPSCPYVFVDARYEHVREDHAVRKSAVLVAIGVKQDGSREVLGFWTARVENEAYWSDFLQDLKGRGLSGVRLVISDAHEGLRKAIAGTFPEAEWQRCKVHFLRNLSSRIPERKRPALLSLAKTIFQQESFDEALAQRDQVVAFYRQARQREAADFLEGCNDVLTHMRFPREHWTKLHSTNVLERLNRELKRRTRVVSIFPNRESLERLTGSLLVEEHEEWMVSRRYISERSMKLLTTRAEELEAIVPGAAKLLESNRPVPPGALGHAQAS